MKNLIKIFTLLVIFMATINSSFAISVSKIDKLVKNSTFNDSATVAISIKRADTNELVYEQHPKKLVNPASTLKVFTTYSSRNILGDDYKFNTSFLKDSQNNLYIKLGADPLLTTAQLKQAIYELRTSGNIKFNNLYFDDSILDKKEYGIGWMWDADPKTYAPKVSSYNLDKNVVTVDMAQMDNGSIVTTLKSSYPMSVISNIQAGAKEEYIEVNRYNWNNPEVVEIYATISKPEQIEIPISSMRRYFIHNLEKAFDDNRITFSGTKYSSVITPANAKVLAEIKNPIARVYAPILQDSDNMKAQTLYKLAAAKKYSVTGNDGYAEQAFNEFYKKIGLETNDIIIKDGCGISRKNLINVDWMTNALNKLYKMKDFETFKEQMAQPGDGTLSKRLHNLRGDAWLKTGSLSNLSAVTGYIKSQDGNTYSVAIITQGFIEKQSTIKAFEDEIIKLIYNR